MQIHLSSTLSSIVHQSENNLLILSQSLLSKIWTKRCNPDHLDNFIREDTKQHLISRFEYILVYSYGQFMDKIYLQNSSDIHQISDQHKSTCGLPFFYLSTPPKNPFYLPPPKNPFSTFSTPIFKKANDFLSTLLP